MIETFFGTSKPRVPKLNINTTNVYRLYLACALITKRVIHPGTISSQKYRPRDSNKNVNIKVSVCALITKRVMHPGTISPLAEYPSSDSNKNVNIRVSVCATITKRVIHSGTISPLTEVSIQ
jgi:hypothetical protein